jgi:hypothetical protein
MYNLISDVVGGIEVVVLEEVLDQPAASPRFVAPAPAPSSGGRLDVPTEEHPAVPRA